MATAKKLPSGSWRVLEFSHYEIVNGKKKRKYESFTCNDTTKAGKYKAEAMAREWRLERQARHRSVSLLDAVNSLHQKQRRSGFAVYAPCLRLLQETPYG